jgi:hypothetical protein
VRGEDGAWNFAVGVLEVGVALTLHAIKLIPQWPD